MQVNHIENRKQFYDKHKDFFSDFPELEYGLYGVKEIKKSTATEIKYATEELWSIFKKVKEHVQRMTKAEFVNLGYKEEMYDFINLDYLTNDTSLSRFDFIVTDDGEIKMIELNNDTPFLVQEAFKMNSLMCREFGIEDVNKNNYTDLTSSFATAIRDCMRYLESYKLKIVIVGKDVESDIEEHKTVQFIRNAINEKVWDWSDYVHFVDIADLRIVIEEDNQHYERGLYTPDMEKIDVLIRPAHPLEFLLEDISEDGEHIGIELLKMVEEKRLAMINSPTSYILQSKVIMALVWHWYETDLILTDYERSIVGEYMLPTYTSEFAFDYDNAKYVKKPVFSREGSSVEIVDNDNTIKSKSDYYNDYMNVYQEYLELPSIKVIVKGEKVEKKYILGSFVTNNIATGLVCRVGNDITEWDSHWIGLGVAEEEHGELLDEYGLVDYQKLNWESDWNGYEVGHDNVPVVGLYSVKGLEETYVYINTKKRTVLELWTVEGEE